MDDQQNGGLEELGNTDPVDSSSEEYVGLGEIDGSDGDAAATVETEDDDIGVMLWEAGGEGLLGALQDILAFASFAKRHVVLTKRLIGAGAPADAGKISVELNALDAQAFSVGLNLVGFFVPELADEAEGLLRQVAAGRRDWTPTEAEQTKYDAARQQVMDEDAAEMLGFESVEEYQAARQEAQREQAQAQAAVADDEIRVSTGGEPHLN